MLRWDMGWDSCTEESLGLTGGGTISKRTDGRGVWFTTENSAPKVDLVAATTNRNCTEDEGVTVNVKTTLNVPDGVEWEGYGGKTCASMASTTSAPTPCQVKFDSAAASNISSSTSSLYCGATRVPGSSCPDDEKSAAQRPVGGGRGGFGGCTWDLGCMMI